VIQPHLSPASQSLFFHNLQGLPPRDVLRLCCLSLRTGTLHFANAALSPIRIAQVSLHEGVICAADNGGLTRLDAVQDLCTWPASTLQWDNTTPQSDGTRLVWNDIAAVAAPVPALSPSLVRPLPGASSRLLEMSPSLTVLTDVVEPRPVALSGPVITLGRAATNDIPIFDTGVSSHHCRVRLEGDIAVLEDLNSSNGTFLNGQPVKETPLVDGDLIRVGTTLLKFELLAPPAEPGGYSYENPAPASAPGVIDPPTPSPATKTAARDPRWLLWSLGVVGVIGTVVAAFFWILTLVL
jgi:hypothetical protein